MRPDRLASILIAVAALASTSIASAQGVAPADTTTRSAAPADTARAAAPADTARAAAPADTTRADSAADTTRTGTAGADTTRGAFAVIDTTRLARRAPPPPPPSETVSFDEERKRGSLSLAQALRGLRPLWVRPLPMVGPEVGPVSLPDAGSRFRTSPPGTRPVSATERPMVAGSVYGIGFLDLATALDAPRAEEGEIFDLMSLHADLEPASFARAGELLAQPPAEFSFERVMPGAPDRLGRPRSALYYGNGRQGELDAGVRFLSSSLGWGIGASHTRHEADGTGPLHRSRTQRYALASGLPRALGHHLWMDGVVFDWTIEDEVPSVNPFTSDPILLQNRSELMDRVIRLHGRASGDRWSSAWAVGAADIRRTQVSASEARDRWRLPEASLEWNARAGSDSGWFARVDAAARSRGIEHRVGESPDVDVRRNEARLGAGIGRAVGKGAGIEASVAGDWRETDPALLDARVSFWSEGSRARFRIDAERAYERPTWIDLLTPVAVIDSGIPNTTSRIRITRGGDPSLPARSLSGLLARASYDLSRKVSVTLEGAVRRVEDDFGWTLARSERFGTIFDTLLVDTRAAGRGDGWASYAGASLRARTGSLEIRGAGWVRGGPERLSPQAGSPPRFGADAAAEGRVVLFGGDLPLVGRIEAHGEGPRTGEFSEPGWISLDGSLRADFGAAAVIVEYTNMLDRVLPSGATDLATGHAIPMPPRSLRLGIVWYLLD
jgi:hypothetical protein